jgi:hypothetical protein
MNLAEMARAYRASLPPNLRRTGATIPEHEAMAVALAHAEACYRPGITTEVPAACPQDKTAHRVVLSFRTVGTQLSFFVLSYN